MALPLRLRRAAALSSLLLKSRTPFPEFRLLLLFVSIPLLPPLPPRPSSRAFLSVPMRGLNSPTFRSSAPLSDRRNDGEEEKKLRPGDILFEGCDYNHWLITMDFPKDPAPTRNEMIETYIQTLAKVVGSVEEAKKRMYVLSTTTYHGFQAVMTEEMSENFHGDKYENGIITPRPLTIQYGRQGRPRIQNRNDRPNYNRPPPPQGNMSFGQQDFRHGEQRNYAPPQTNNHLGHDGRGYGPQGGGDYVHPGERRDIGRAEQRNYAQDGGRDFVHPGEWRDIGRGEQRIYAQDGARYAYQGEWRD